MAMTTGVRSECRPMVDLMLMKLRRCDWGKMVRFICRYVGGAEGEAKDVKTGMHEENSKIRE
jgi:hypothetical protein